jgi:Eco57I restriction-modification methylase
VQTLRAAAGLLAAADSIERLAPLAAVCSCIGAVSPLDASALHSLGLTNLVDDVHVAAGRGALRALLVVVPSGVALRDVLPRLAARLASRAPHCLWLVAATQPTSKRVALMAWSDDRRPPRVSAIIVDRTRVLDSDAETVRALSAITDERDLLIHARWVEVLGREALSARFYRALERALARLAESSNRCSREVRRELALLNASRLLFLSFLEAKGWLDGDLAFIAHQFDRCMMRGGEFHNRALRPLFFGTLNTPIRKRAVEARAFGRIPFLNGGLFAPTALERRNRTIAFSDEAYGELLDTVFAQYRFTAREATSSWTEAAVDPEMLGRAFESLMGGAERRRTGAFYTPFSLVERVANEGLDVALGARPTLDGLERFTVLDPACGSGAFLVHILERLAAMHVRLGDTRSASAIRRDVLARSIYGVDVNPTAVWLCELRLWLSIVIESEESDPTAVLPLPNLDRNIRVGDALSGRAFGPETTHVRGASHLRALRQRYANANGARKDSLARQLDRVERSRALETLDAELTTLSRRRRDLLAARRGHDLFGGKYQPSADEREAANALRRRAASLRTMRRRIASGGALPFSFPVHFADVGACAGFGLVVGNPPWVRLHQLSADQRAEFRREFDVARVAAWQTGARAAGAATGFAGQVDVAALFVERSLRLLAPGAALALLVPVKLWRSLAGGGLRRMLAQETQVRRIEDFSAAPSVFDAAVYPSLIVAARNGAVSPTQAATTRVAIHHRGGSALAWQTSAQQLTFDDSTGAPWIFLPPDARRAFEKIRAAGRPLAETPIGRPLLGVKCGCNDAFVVRLLDADDELAHVVTHDDQRIVIERRMLRRLLRGEHVRRWRTLDSGERLIWTHDATDAPLVELPKHAARWLTAWRRHLSARSDARRRTRWWSVFRTEGARIDRPRVVWADVGREPRACVLDAGDPAVALNSCYVVRCADDVDALAFAALLNGPIAGAWLNAAAEPARGGYRRYLGWTLSLLPLPADWQRARRSLAPLARRGLIGESPSARDLFEASLAAYQLEADDVAALVAWSCE